MFRMTQRDRQTIETLRRSPQWQQLTQMAFAERVQRRERIVLDSAPRQEELRKAYDAHGPLIRAADARLKKADEDLIAARDARDDAQRRADGARSRLEGEQMRLRRALHDDNEPLIGRISNLCIGLEDRLRLKVWTTVYFEKNILGAAMPSGVTNSDEVRQAMEAVRRVATEMNELAESPYPQNLPELLAARHQLLLEIDRKFDCGYITARELELEAV